MFRRPPRRLIPEVPFDPWRGDSAAASLRQAIEAGDVRSFANSYARSEVHRREFLVGAMTIREPLEVINDWPDEEPGSALAFLLRGTQRSVSAWHSRGANTGVAGSLEPFFDGLRQAEHDLLRSVELHDDGIAWSRLVNTGRGLEISLDEQWVRYCRAVAVVPGLCFASDQILLSLSDRWFGSHEQMFEFARSTSQASPEGSPLHRLIATAHYERLVDLQADAESSTRYAADPQVQQELIAASQRSVFSPAFAASPEHVLTLNWFAFTLDSVGRYDASRPLLARIGSSPTVGPWHRVRSPSEHFHDARLRAGLPPL